MVIGITQLQYSFKSIVAAGNIDTNYITIQPNINRSSALCSDPIWESSSQSYSQKVQYERIIKS